MPLSPIREITDLHDRPIQAAFDFVGRENQADTENLTDFDFVGVETQHSTHAIHPYVAAINPPLASTFIKRYVPEGATILDPFCGGGGVLVEAILNNRNAVGYDVNPLATLISQVKTTPLPIRLTMPEYTRILQQARSTQPTPDLVEEVPNIIKNWYNEDSLAELRALQVAINETGDNSIKRLFQVALSGTARDVMLTYRGEIRLRKLQAKDLERFKPNVLGAFRKRAETAISRVSQLPQAVTALVEMKDARSIEADRPYHSVISSPPYGDDTNGVGYFQFSRNMLYWVGYSLEELKKQRQDFLGSNITSKRQMPPSQSLSEILAVIAERKKIHYKQAFAFYDDYYQVLTRLSQCVQEYIIIIIGDRVLSRTKINNGHITTELMAALGYRLEQYHNRELKKKRIANLGGDGGGISVEHILVYHR